MIAATGWELATEHLATFVFGVIVGFALTSRYRIVKVRSNGKESDDRA